MNKRKHFLKLVEVGNVGVLACSFGTLAQHLCGFVATHSSTPLTAEFLVLVGEVSLGSADKGSQFPLVLALHVLQCNDSSGLLVHDRAKTGFALYDDVGHAHLAAEGGEEDDELDWVNVVCDDDEGGFLCFDECDAVVQAVFDEEGFLGVLGLSFLLLSSGFRNSLKTRLLLLLSLRTVLVQKLEQLRGSVLVEGMRELGNGGRYFETLTQDDFLTLEADVFRPFYETGQVGFGTNILADTEVFRLGFE